MQMMMMKQNKKTLYSVQTQKEMKKDQLIDLLIKGFAAYVVIMLFGCFIGLFL